MKKRILMYILALSLMVAAALPAAAAEVTEPANVPREPGWCGEAITWAYEDGTLTISGEGEMDDFPEGAPWEEYRGEIERVVFQGGVTYIGDYSFKNYDALEDVDFGDAMYEIGQEAFSSCDGLTAIYLPASFKVFGERSFQSCRNLTEIHSEGKFPSFRENCLWDTYATIYFPVNRPWKVEYIQQLEEAFHGRIEFLASDGSDPYQPTEATEAPAVTEPETVPPATEPETEPETRPTAATEPQQTQAPTVPETEPATEPAEETQEPTVPEEQDDKLGGGLFFGLLAVGIVLTLVIVLALIIKGNRKKGRFSA